MTSEQTAAALRAPGLKLLLVAGLTILMAVPLFLVQLVLSDRQGYASEVWQDIAGGWGGPQTVAGPIVFVPFTRTYETVVDGKTTITHADSVAALLPDTLQLVAQANVEERHRGLFDVPVYRTNLGIHAVFSAESLKALIPVDAEAHWDRAYTSVIVGDTHGLTGNAVISVNGDKRDFEPSAGRDYPGVAGIHASLGLKGQPGQLDLQTGIALRGTRELKLAPLGENTTASMRSNWQSPSFSGSFLPDARRLGAKGFDAEWKIPYLARGFGQSFEPGENFIRQLQDSSFGVLFYQPVDYYQLVQRSLKYAIFFVGLAFLLFFVMEIVAGRRLHAIQYILVGSAQVVFYLLLLSFSEHVGFGNAYFIAAAATVVLTAAYGASAYGGWLRAGLLGVALGTQYGLLYMLLKAEDNALLIGSIVLFLALAATMYVTRRIDWYQVAPRSGN